MPPQAKRQPRRKRTRDLSHAVTLKAAEVYALYGIPPSSLHEHATDAEPTRRLPSIYIPSRGGRKGTRLFRRADLEAWLAARETKSAA